MTIFANTD